MILHKDGELSAFSLDNGQQLLDVSLELKSSQLTCFEIGVTNLVASGSAFPFLIVKSLVKGEQHLYKLPTGCRGADRLVMLRDQNLLAMLSEGYFYLLDISYASEGGKITVRLNMRIPHEQVKCFDVDQNMSTLVLGTSAGNVFVYDLAKALENEKLISKKKLAMGVEQDLVITTLEKVNIKEV